MPPNTVTNFDRYIIKDVQGTGSHTGILYGNQLYKTEAPTVSQIAAMLDSSKNYYSKFHFNCREVDDYYYMRNRIFGAEEQYPFQVNPATAMSIIDTAVNHVNIENLDIEVPAPSPSARGKAEKMSKFLMGFWHGQPRPVLRQRCFDAFAYGVAWSKIQFAPERWPVAPMREMFDTDKDYYAAVIEFIDKRHISRPFTVRSVHPTNIVWDDSELGPRWVIEFYDRPTQDVFRRFPEWNGQASDGYTQWIEYWDDKYCVFIAGNQIVRTYEHGYDFLPYTMVEPADSLRSYSGRPEERYQGFVHPILSLIDAEARYMTRADAIWARYSYPSVDFRNDSNDESARRDAGRYKLFGARNVLSRGTEVDVSPMPQQSPDTPFLLNEVRMARQKATYPDVVDGFNPTGVSAGWALGLMASSGALAFSGVASGIARSIEEDNEKLLRMVETKAGVPVTVSARTTRRRFEQRISPDDIRHYYTNHVILKAEAPEEQERSALLGKNLYQADIISKMEAMRRAGVQRPMEEMTWMQAEKWLETDMIRMFSEQEIAKRYKLLDQLLMLQNAEGAGGGGDVLGGLLNTGNRFEGLPQLPRMDERSIQAGRVASLQGQQSVYPQGISDLAMLGGRMATNPGTPQRTPNGRMVGVR